MNDLRAAVGLRVIMTLLLLQRGTVFGSADNPNDKSICRQYHRVTTTKLVSYRETYISYDHYDYENRDYTKTRLNFRNENITKWERIEMCCDGYEPHQKAQEASTCVPVCPSDCVNGTCLRPNVCMCDPGYRMEMNSLTSYSECVPICASGCHGGKCVAPNTCDCDYGYFSSKNQTSCEPTCATFGNEDPQGCPDHATCVAPDTCECDHGYISIPHSSPTEKRGIFDWFHPPITPRTVSEASTEKMPFERNPKFYARNIPIPPRKMNHEGRNTCQPLCKPNCGNNSSCVAPNICQCDDGYKSTLDQGTNDTQCLPVCNKTCFNGFCVSPNKCKCRDGYKPHRWLNEDFCEPICQKDCVNAKCSAPNQCDCLDGYEKLMTKNGEHEETSVNICIAVCPGKCPNGICVSPGKCHCNPGYVLEVQGSNGTDANVTFEGNCRPLCKPECSRGSICIGPNQCELDQRFKDSRKMNVVFVNDTHECDVDDNRFYKENGTCVCQYNMDERKCTIPALCAEIFTDDLRAHEKFAYLQSILFSNDTSGAKIDTFVQESLRCTDKCRFAIFPKSDIGTTNGCYQLDTYHQHTGLISTGNSYSLTSMICLTKIEPKCSAIESKIVNSHSSGLVGGTIGAIFVIAFIIGVALIIKKSLNQLRPGMRKIRGTSQSMGNMMEQSETLGSPFHTDDRPDP